jgi:hypothetical protein
MDLVTLTQKHLIVGAVDGFPVKRDYHPQDGTSYSTKHNVHNGQEKLLLAEIEFLTRVHIESRHKTPVPMLCVYTGAYPCKHMSRLLRMFPNVYFLLVDPRFLQIHLKWNSKRVAVCPYAFDNHTVHAINMWRYQSIGTHWVQAKLDSLGIDRLQVCDETLLFMSDIRANAFDEDSIRRDMQLQANWFRGLNATAGLLKFRLPFCKHVLDTATVQYLDGVLYMPIYGPPSTTECRLYVVKGCGDKIYNIIQHERLMAGFEGGERHHPYQFGNKLFPSFDTAAEAVVLDIYKKYRLHLIPQV